MPLEMIKSILFGEWGDYWQPFLLWRLFYRLKALICCILNREPTSGDFNFFNYNHIVLTFTDGGYNNTDSGGPIYWFEAIAVGEGIFRNWWCTYYQDSSA